MNLRTTTKALSQEEEGNKGHGENKIKWRPKKIKKINKMKSCFSELLISLQPGSSR